MEENSSVEAIKPAETFVAGSKAQFPEMVKIEPCSINECSKGHRWPPQLAIANCGGCGGPILLVRMVSCPVCNEPVTKLKLRTDHTTQGYGIAALCRGQKSFAETTEITMERHHAEDAISKWDEVTGRVKV